MIATQTSTVEAASPARRNRRHLGVELLPLKLFLLSGWGRAAIEKLIDPEWWSAQYLRDFLAGQRPHMLVWFRWLSDALLEPFAPQVAITVLVTQLAIAICLVCNFKLREALWAGIVLNLCFTMAGRVNPSAFYLVMQVAMLFALSRPTSVIVAVRRASLWMVPALLVLPFARTLHPAEVIDDPALMISFIAVVAAITTLVRGVGAGQLFDIAASTAVGTWVLQFADRLGIQRQLVAAPTDQ